MSTPFISIAKNSINLEEKSGLIFSILQRERLLGVIYLIIEIGSIGRAIS